MKKNKFVLPLIIILLIFFLPCSLYGIYNQFVLRKEGRNPDHLPKLDNKLYFYDSGDNLIGVYECQTDVCDRALPEIDDEYLVYKEGISESLGVFGGEYIFALDGEVIKLHNLKTNKSIAEFSLIKNYGLNIVGNNIIVKNSQGSYGLFNMDNIMFTIPANYDFMGIANSIGSNELSIDRIAVKDSTGWFIIDSSDQKLSVASLDPIYDYDKNYIYHMSNDNTYIIFDYSGRSILSGMVITKIFNSSEFHVLLDNDNQLWIYDYSYENIISQYSRENIQIDFEVVGEEVKIYSQNEIIETININK